MQYSGVVYSCREGEGTGELLPYEQISRWESECWDGVVVGSSLGLLVSLALPLRIDIK
jgi:hypothetical protein